MSRPTIYKCIAKALAMGPEAGLKDKYHSPKAAVITDDAKAWVVNLACTKPKEHGYAAEIWSHRLLARHARHHAPQAGHECLNNAAKATIQRILKELDKFYPKECRIRIILDHHSAHISIEEINAAPVIHRWKKFDLAKN